MEHAALPGPCAQRAAAKTSSGHCCAAAHLCAGRLHCIHGNPQATSHPHTSICLSGSSANLLPSFVFWTCCMLTVPSQPFVRLPLLQAPQLWTALCVAAGSARLVRYAQAYAVLGNVMSLVGGFASISCSLLMPSLFYLILFWKELSRLRRAGACPPSLFVHCACRRSVHDALQSTCYAAAAEL